MKTPTLFRHIKPRKKIVSINEGKVIRALRERRWKVNKGFDVYSKRGMITRHIVVATYDEARAEANTSTRQGWDVWIVEKD